MKKYFVIMIAVASLLTACGGGKEKAIENIQSLNENPLFDSIGNFDTPRAIELKDAYLSYADKYAKDSLAPEYLFSAAHIGLYMHEPKESISFLERIVMDYPDHPRCPDAYFQMGNIYENTLRDLKSARSTYEKLIELFPEERVAKDAAILLPNVGKSAEQLLAEILANADTSNTDTIN